MNYKKQKKICEIGIYVILVTAALTIILPMVFLGENYIFTIHDYLDEWPSWFNVLRNNNLFWAVDSQMPVMNGVSTCYLYFDFGIYRLLNYLFGFIWGEIINKTLGIILGYFAMNELLSEIFKKEKTEFRCFFQLVSIAYATSPVYPNWTISFAVLPFLFLELYRYMLKAEQGRGHFLLYLTFGFFVYFPCIGIFVLGIWALGLISSSIMQKKLNTPMLAAFISMLVSVVICNINIFIYTLRGDELNRSLVNDRKYYDSLGEGLLKWLESSVASGVKGQYHAAPVLILIVPFCTIGILFLLYYAVAEKKFAVLKLPFIITGMMISFCFIYGAQAIGIFPLIFSKIFPVLSGFNFGRIVYFNNVLWYLLAVLLALQLSARWRNLKKIVMVCAVLQIFLILMSNGQYQDTRRNLFYADSIREGAVSYKEFYDVGFFSTLKKEIDYKGEGVVSIGYHPSVMMYNGYCTLDGYMNTNPMSYHNSFREIIEPMFDKYPEIKEYYDTWGGRLYVYTNGSKDVKPKRDIIFEEREALINTDAFGSMGGKYIFSLYKLSNAANLNLELVYHMEEGTRKGIYSKIYVYELIR